MVVLVIVSLLSSVCSLFQMHSGADDIPLYRMKALLFTLVREFEFELAVPVEDISKKFTIIVQRPVVLSDPEGGNQMPLLLKSVQ